MQTRTGERGDPRKRDRDGGVLERQVSIIEAVAAATEGLFLSEIGEAVGLPRPTVHRLVGGLVDTGLLAPRGRGRKAYVAGPRLRRLLHGNVPGERIERLVGPALRKLVDRFQETSYLARFDGARVRSVAMAVPERDWHGHVHPGNEMPVHASASGKAIFAFQPHPVVERALRQAMAKFTRFTKTSPTAVRRELRQVRGQGYAICREEIDLGIVAYACPVELADAGVIYSVGLAGPIGRMGERPEHEIIAVLRTAADQIAAALSRLAA